jgi:hypothetical protein
MKPEGVAGIIRLAAAATADLRGGERVTVQVLKVLAPGKWAVGLKGRVFPAASTVPLLTGDRLSAVVERSGRRIVLRLQTPAAAGRPGELTQAGALAQTAAQALLREGLAADEAATARLAQRLRGSGGREGRTARTLAAAAAKGIDLDSPGIEELLALLHFEDAGDRSGYRRHRLPRRRDDLAAEVKAGIERDRGDNALSLFNALRSEQGTWVALPFLFRHGGRDLSGTARILYQETRPVRLALEVRAHPGGSAWGFALPLRGGARRLRVFCGSERGRRRARAEIGDLRGKLQNHGVEVDDSINDTLAFDGYTAEGGGVDLLG